METEISLSGREVELLQHLADGKKLEEAADEMSLREQTVRGYVSRVREKLDAPTTANAIAIAIRRGIID